MTPLLISCSLIALTLFPLYLLRQVSLNRQTLIQSEQARLELEQLLEIKSTEGETAYPGMRVTVEITDPLALAKREQPLTKYLSQLAPELIVKKVYEQVASEIESGLKEKSVDAKINIEKR